MTYKDHFVVEVKSRGKILRVKDDAVHLPFGSEYSLLLKNLHSRRASIKIDIDGNDVLGGSSLVLNSKQDLELMGFLDGQIVKNKFKFIQKTKEIQEHRGDKLDDGLIRVEFAFEKPEPEVIKKTIITERHYEYPPYIYIPPAWPRRTIWWYEDNNIVYGGTDHQQFSYTNSAGETKGNTQISSCFNSRISENESNVVFDNLNQDEGITVKGSECRQDFGVVAMGDLEQSNVIIIKLRGYKESGENVTQPVTVQTKLTCSTCGKTSKSSFKFCPNCGTFLE